MIKQAFETDFHQLGHLTVREMTERIIQVHYPQLTVRLNRVEEQITRPGAWNNAEEKAILVRIRQELNGMLAKEQMLLFPLLLLLQKENRKSDCSPFKLVKKHYQSLLSCLQNLRFLLRADTTTYEQQQPVLAEIDELETCIMRLQRVKEKHLFAPFKDCNNNCKISRNE
jgi:hypothetical protein